ncbi:MAG TPA: RNA polymerase sigma factor [Solirubrobacterales bacterium]|nr:RNA polymerase sigma factor [Solirubrobacterales bacterium]
MGDEEPASAGGPPGATREDDRKLVAALRRGDEEAFRTLVDEHGPLLLRLAMMHLPSRAIAEEVVQDTWLAVLDGIDRFEGRSALRTWIASILLNKARTRGQREGRILPFALFRRRYEEGSGPALEPERFQGRRGERPGWWARPPAAWESPEEQLEGAETREALFEAIRSLPVRQREVITLRDVSGWSAEEVRNVLDLSETNQRVLLHRARSKVRAALEEHFATENAER